MSGQDVNIHLKTYEEYAAPRPSLTERLYTALVIASVLCAVCAGLFFRTVKPLPEMIMQKMIAVRAQFVMKEEPKKAPPPVKKVVEEKPKDTEPVDLTKNPELAQKVDDIQKDVTPTTTPVRRVYGLRRVYSMGIGAGGSMADAVIGKLGNTIAKDFDTVVASVKEIKGQIVSATTVTSAPRISKVVKPEYTKEMLDNKIEGVIRVKVLVDVDGKVKKAIPLNDLGFGSAKAAVDALLQMEFAPAMRGSEAVAVWIAVPIRFVLLGNS